MSIRDLLLNFLIAIGIASFMLVVAIIDSLPLWVVAIIAVIVWAVYIVLVIRDHSRDIRYPIVRVRPDRTRDIPERRLPKSPQTIPYDQEEDKE